MNIDWFTFTAQIINFLLLVVLLRWLLYRPIVRAMNQREEKIANRLEEADQKCEEAEQKVQEYEGKTRQIQQQREELLKDAQREAEEEKRRLLREAKEQIDRRRQQWKEALQREQEDFLADLRRRVGELGLHVARRTLEQLADVELEHRMYDAFASRLEQLGEEQRSEIVHHLSNGQSSAAIRSAFEMPNDQRERFRDLIHKLFDTDADVSNEQSKELICGVELEVGGYRLGWNMNDFLRDLESNSNWSSAFRL
jgi:F-type H+-transporting ATPase subunit b